MPIGPARMSLLEHLGEFRMRLVRVVVCLLIATLFFYLATPTIAQLLLTPVAEYLPVNESGNVDLNVFGAFDAFSVRINIALWTALVACAPVVFWQILAFFLPALKPKERKWFIPTFFVAVFLFLLGVVFCYFVILNPAFGFLTGQASGFAVIFPEASQWIDIIIKFEIGFGCAFLLPLLVFYLTLFNIVPYKKLRASWRYAYVGLLIFSAMVTPDSSPVTMGLMFAAMVALYEISLLASRIAIGKREKRLKQIEEQQQKEWEEAKEELRSARQAAREALDRHLWDDEGKK